MGCNDSVRSYISGHKSVLHSSDIAQILRIGSRITSKRISQFLEHCFPWPYIMADKHPYRHDPSHIVTDRIQSTISEFSACLLKSMPPQLSSKWISGLKAVDSLAAGLYLYARSTVSLSEPYVAHVLSEVLVPETALFMGNSMHIRDANMYSKSGISGIDSALQFGLPC